MILNLLTIVSDCSCCSKVLLSLSVVSRLKMVGQSLHQRRSCSHHNVSCVTNIMINTVHVYRATIIWLTLYLPELGLELLGDWLRLYWADPGCWPVTTAPPELTLLEEVLDTGLWERGEGEAGGGALTTALVELLVTTPLFLAVLESSLCELRCLLFRSSWWLLQS